MSTSTEVADIISALKESGSAIPISITSTTQLDPTQFWISTIISVVGIATIIWWMGAAFFMPWLSSLYVRVTLWRFKNKTNRNYILIKHTESSLFHSSMIGSNTLRDIEKAILSFKGKPFDIILHTPGGVIFFTQILSRIIKESGANIRCFVPYYSMSGGTMLALSCKELYMGKLACLGPVDPQLGGLFSYGSSKSWQEVVRIKGKKASDSSIQNAFVGEQYTKTLKDNLMYLLRDRYQDHEKLMDTVDYLTDGNVEHALQLTPDTLISMGIQIKCIDDDTQRILASAINNEYIEGVYYG